MSLINDALNRAKKTQQENPPPTPPLQFRPPEVAHESDPRSTVLIVGGIFGLGLVVVLGGLLFWAVAQQRQASLQAEARTLEQAARVKPVVVAPVVAPEQSPTNSLPVVEESPPAPELKLQGILFNPTKPSAAVNGQTVFIGDRVNGFRVLAITARTVTLASSTETNVLSLSQ
jgi:hypothetical protein